METQTAFMVMAAAGALLVAVLLRRRDWPALRYGGLCLSFGLWSAARGAAALGLDWSAALGALALACVGPAAFAFSANAAAGAGRARKLAPLLWAAAPLIALVAFGAGPGRGDWMQTGLLLWATTGVALGGPSLWRQRAPRSSRERPEETRLRYLALAHALLCAAFAADLALWLLGAPRVATLLAGAVYLYTGYLLLARVRIADLRQLLGNALALGLLAAGLAGGFAALRIWVDPIDLFVLNAFVASCLLLLFYPAVRQRIQLAIERRFVAGKVELERTLLPLRERLSQIFTLDELLRELLATLEQTERITASAVFLREDPHLGFQQAASTGLSPRPRVNLIREPVFVRALEAGEVLLSEELERGLADARSDERHERLETLRRILHELDAQLILPLRAGEHLVGFWSLTDWKRKEQFSSSEVELLASVAAASAVSIENSRTFERIRARDRLVNLGEMAAGLAHELRNPLATIRGALAVLQESEDEPRSELSQVVVEEILRLDRVVGAFLDYARPSLHRVRIVDFAAFVTGSVEAAARRPGLEGVDLELDIEGEIPPVTADRSQLETVIENVMQNAGEALDGQGRIRVVVRAIPDEAPDSSIVEISIHDDGPGMDEETLERAFIPFYTTKDRGTGLGLALCERLLRAEGGRIKLRSKPGEGTVVTIRIPTGRLEPETEAEETASE